jgi:hypothetical protein
MLLADWEAQNLGQLALTVTSVNQTCANCHSGGAGGNFMSADSTATFNTIKTFPYVQVYATTDAQLNVVQADRLLVKGQELGHPAFELPAALQQGLQNFFELTHARYLEGSCPPAP